ncbi:unnamed protein product [Sphagnum troendelagicum]|uniref:PC-Esterase n=1 Tax=Sphagnum troendelagicum TaxID=128251 RepID=A0ABP0TWR5_9BRYO
MATRHGVACNRVVVLSVAVFILLLVYVHLLPYFSPFSSLGFRSLKTFASSSSSSSSHDYCLSCVHEIEWRQTGPTQISVVRVGEAAANKTVERIVSGRDWQWKPKALEDCGFRELGRQQALQLLHGSWIVVAGDSQARFLLVAMLELLLPSIDEHLRPQIFKSHSNFQYVLEEEQVRLDYVWAPFVTNLTELSLDFHRNQSYPDVLVMGAGLWHMLYNTDAADYGSSLVNLKRAVGLFSPSASNVDSGPSEPAAEEEEGFVTEKNLPMPPHIFWLNLPMLIPSLMQTDMKRQKMTRHQNDLYDAQLHGSKILHPEGPFLLLDIRKLSGGCSPECSLDGIHYSNATYRAVLHVLINTLLIATHQPPST